jgi:Ca2+-binding RTX toxin-like protein
LIGDKKDNLFIGGSGKDVINGGDGFDTVQFQNATTASIYTGKIAHAGEAVGDVYISIERLLGSNAADILIAGGPDSIVDGGSGDDTLTAFGGTAIGGAGADKFVGPFGIVSYVTSTVGLTIDLINPSNNTGDAVGDTFLVGTSLGRTGKNDQVAGTNFNDKMVGGTTDFGFRLFGLDGDDHLIGTATFAYMVGGAGNDTIEGQSPLFNEASYQTSTVGLTIDLADGANSTGDAAGDTYINIGSFVGSKFDDVLVGGTLDNIGLNGALGNDELFAGSGGGVYHLDGGPGADILHGSSWLHSASYGSSSFGESQYGTSKEGVTASLFNPAVNTGDAKGDVYDGVDAIEGGDFNDVLTADNDVNGIVGWDGDDVLDAMDGDDPYIMGWAGKDTLKGGAGADQFQYWSADHGGDIIVDFGDGADQLVMQKNGFGGGLSGQGATPDTNFFVSSANDSKATQGGHGQFIFNQATDQLFWDVDGIGSQAAVLIATFQNGHNLIATDIQLS